MVRKYHALLQSSGDLWDQGHHEQTISLVTALRVLFVGEGGAGLLNRVTRLKDLRMTDSAWIPPTTPNTAYFGGGLTVFALSANQPTVVPRCQAERTMNPQPEHPTTRFSDWWDRDLAVRHGDSGWTRKFLVYEMANTDAIHVDARDNDYVTLSGPLDTVVFSGINGERPADGFGPASLRQIAWEVQTTLDRLAY